MTEITLLKLQKVASGKKMVTNTLSQFALCKKYCDMTKVFVVHLHEQNMPHSYYPNNLLTYLPTYPNNLPTYLLSHLNNLPTSLPPYIP